MTGSPVVKHDAIDFLVGVDGGGSGTRARLVRRDGTLLGQGVAGPSALGQGAAQAWRHVRQAIEAAFAAAGIASPPLHRIGAGIGLAGAERDDAVSALRAAAAELGALALDNDGHAALLGAHAGRPGVAIVVGTGSVGHALHPDGRRARVGGWGFPAGDEGSGAWLGLRAVALAQRSLDGRAPRGALADAVLEVTGASPAAMTRWCDRAGRRDYAQFAPLLFEVESRDAAAQALLARSAQAFEALARALDPEGRLPLAAMGSIGRRLWPRLSPALRERGVEPAGDACAGALQLIESALRRDPR